MTCMRPVRIRNIGIAELGVVLYAVPAISGARLLIEPAVRTAAEPRLVVIGLLEVGLRDAAAVCTIQIRTVAVLVLIANSVSAVRSWQDLASATSADSVTACDGALLTVGGVETLLGLIRTNIVDDVAARPGRAEP